MKSPLVSIIVPVFNGDRYVKDALDSIFAQTYSNVEVIVVNDGSTDLSEEVILIYRKSINYICQENRGVAEAYNAGLKICKGDYICFLEQDDVWLPQKVEKQVRHLKNNKQNGMVYSRYFINYVESPHEKDKVSTLNIEGKCFSELFMTSLGISTLITFSSVMVRRSVIEEIGKFDKKLSIAVDYDVWLKIAFRHPVGFIDQPLIEYRVHEGNTSSDSLRALLDDCNILESWLKNKEAKKLLGKLPIQKRFEWLYSNIAWIYRRKGNKKHELVYLRKLLKLKPFSIHNLTSYLVAHLDEKKRNKLSWYLARLK